MNKFHNSRKKLSYRNNYPFNHFKMFVSFLWALSCLSVNIFFVMLCLESYVIFYRQSHFHHWTKCFYLPATRPDAFLYACLRNKLISSCHKGMENACKWFSSYTYGHFQYFCCPISCFCSMFMILFFFFFCLFTLHFLKLNV